MHICQEEMQVIKWCNYGNIHSFPASQEWFVLIVFSFDGVIDIIPYVATLFAYKIEKLIIERSHICW